MSFAASLFSAPRRTVIRAASLALCVLVFLFAACTLDPERGNLHGDWKFSGYTSYTIDTAAKTVEYVGSYKADIKNEPNFTAASGVLIIYITEGKDAVYGPDGDDEDEYADLTGYNDISGKYGALYWTDLTPESVKFADAWQTVDEEYTHVLFDTLAEAQAAFHLDTAADYLFGGNWDGVSPYNK